MNAMPPAPRGVINPDPNPAVTMTLDAAGGVEITDIDTAQPLSLCDRDRIKRLFRAHPILVFRGQLLSKAAQYAFTENFGEIEGLHVGRHTNAEAYTAVHTVSNLDADGHPSGAMKERGNYFWHTDKSYHAIPSLLTMLHAVDIPQEGGQTQFANTRLAYAALDDATKARIADLRAVHSWEGSRINSGSPPATDAQKLERPPVDHPIVRTHPDTGEKMLYLGNHSHAIIGMGDEEGRALLAELLAHATAAEFVYSHQWRPGDLVLWDNRCLVHRARVHANMGQERRVLHRTVVRGDAPY